jgi:hypothetical protein
MFRILTSLTSISSTVGDAWCQLMHPDPMWPVRGEYQCRVCQRKFPVVWEKPATAIVQTPDTAARAEAIAHATVTQSL